MSNGDGDGDGELEASRYVCISVEQPLPGEAAGQASGDERLLLAGAVARALKRQWLRSVFTRPPAVPSKASDSPKKEVTPAAISSLSTQLSRGGVAVALGSRACNLLQHLVAHAERGLSRHRLMEEVSRGPVPYDGLTRPIGAAQRWGWMLARTARLWRATPRQLGHAPLQPQQIALRRR